MKRILFFLILSMTNFVFGQPVLNVSDIDPLNNNYITFSSTSNTTNTVTASGVNQVWDFSGLSLTQIITITNTSVATAPFATNFPTSNYFTLQGFNSQEQFGIYKLSADKLEILGVTNAVNILANYQNPQTIFVLPLTYTTSYTDTFQLIGASGVESNTTTYDAYGTLITPYGIFANVIRIKTFDGNSNIYSWFTVNPFQQLLNATVTNGIVSFQFAQPLNLAVEESLVNRKFSVFPNPVNDNFTVFDNIDLFDSFLSVYDVFGNVIINKKPLSKNDTSIEFAEFASGLYFVKITSADNKILFTEKLLKK